MLETKQITLKCRGCNVQKSVWLGLSQVRQLRENNSLRLLCSSCGSLQFWTSTDPKQLAVPRRSATKSILLVEDDDLIVKLLQKVLESWEATIEIACNGRDALAKLASRNFDLMICDVQMPEMSGEELYQHIQANALIPPRRIIFLTGDKRPQTKQFLDSTGCYYLFKPIQFLDFSDQVQAVLTTETSGREPSVMA